MKYKTKKNGPLLSKSTLKYLVYAKYFGSKYGVYKINTYLYGRWCFITTFPITCPQKNYNTSKTKFPQKCFLTKYKFFYIKKVKVEKYLLLLFEYFFVFLSPFSMFFFCLLSIACIFFEKIFFFIFKESALFST